MVLDFESLFPDESTSEAGDWLDQNSEKNVNEQYRSNKLNKTLDRVLSNPLAVLDCPDNVGDTPLHVAVRVGNQAAVDKLLANNANPNFPNVHGNTPLHFAAFWNRQEICRSLLRHDAQIMMQNNSGKSPLDYTKPVMSQFMLAASTDRNKVVTTPVPPCSVTVAWKFRRAHSMKINSAWNTHASILFFGDKLPKKSHKHSYFVAHLWNKDIYLKALKDQTLTKGQIEMIKLELNAIWPLQHEYLLPILGACITEPKISVYYEYINSPALEDLLCSSSVILEVKQALTWARQIALGLEYLHSHGVVHTSLEPASIFVGADMNLKMCEYGFFKSVFSRTPKKAKVVFNIRYVAPELLTKKIKDASKPADIYSLGLTLFFLFVRKMPFDDETNITALGLKLAFQSISLDIPDYIPGHLAQLITNCCSSLPENRPTIGEVLGVLQEAWKLCDQ